jgi:hypothetical protein
VGCLTPIDQHEGNLWVASCQRCPLLPNPFRDSASIVATLKSEDKQISLSDPDARSMATSGKDTGIVGYNVQIAVDTQHHLIVAHEVTNVGSDRHQLASMADQARAEMVVETLNVVADRGYYDSQEILACEEAGITVTLPRPLTSGAKAAGRFGKQDFIYVAAEDIYRCPAGERLTYRFTVEEHGKMLRRYWTTACRTCALVAVSLHDISFAVGHRLDEVRARQDHFAQEVGHLLPLQS